MHENAKFDDNFNPDMEVFICYFENLNILNDYDIYTEYKSGSYTNVDVTLNMGVTTCQHHSSPQKPQVKKTSFAAVFWPKYAAVSTPSISSSNR